MTGTNVEVNWTKPNSKNYTIREVVMYLRISDSNEEYSRLFKANIDKHLRKTRQTTSKTRISRSLERTNKQM